MKPQNIRFKLSPIGFIRALQPAMKVAGTSSLPTEQRLEILC